MGEELEPEGMRSSSVATMVNWLGLPSSPRKRVKKRSMKPKVWE